MIWNSIPIMTLLDLFIIMLCVFCWIFYINYTSVLNELNLNKSILISLCGITLIAVFYLADLASMYIMPTYMTKEQSMQLMKDLHLNYNWIVNVISLSMIVFGLIMQMKVLYPRLRRLIKEKENILANQNILIEEKTAELRIKNEDLESFNYSLAHDLRTPLRSMTGYCHIIKEDLAEESSLEHMSYIERINASAKDMWKIIDDMLLLARVGNKTPVFNEIDIKIIANRVKEKIIDNTGDRQVKWNIDNNMKVIADANLVNIILSNLMGNAYKFSKNNNETVISVRRCADRENCFAVQDNGIGIDMRYSDKIFKPFQTLHHKNEYEGTGIGLATVARAVRHHDGDIWLESKVGEGASFYFTLNVSGSM